MAGALAAALLALLMLGALAPLASGDVVATSELFNQFGSEGSAAGQVGAPGNIAIDPVTGHVLVTSSGNNGNSNRVDEFTPWGEFVKAFGWDVAPGAVNEQQEIRVRAAAGQFNLGFGASTTADLAFDASGEEVEDALNALPSISSGGGSVEVDERAGNPATATPYIYTVTFKGSLGSTDVPQLNAGEGTTPLSGGDPATSLEARTRADGTAGGTGLEACTADSGCQVGLEGAGAGERKGPGGLAVDAGGDIYIFERKNFRVQKFDSAGRFLLMFGGDVNQGPDHPGGLCTAANIVEGDNCGAGTEGSSNGQFGVEQTPWTNGTYIAVGTDGTVYVGDKNRIQKFEPTGVYKSQFPLPKPGNPAGLAFDTTSGSLYFTYSQFPTESPGVFKLNLTTGAVLGELKVKNPSAVATDGDGDVYVVENVNNFSDRPELLEFGADGAPIGSCCATDLVAPGQWFALPGLATNAAGDLYAISTDFLRAKSYIRSYGPLPLTFEGPPLVPPSIEAQYAASVGSENAVLKAEINPHFWENTRYFLQYGTADCAANPCDSQPLPPGEMLTNKVVDAVLTTAGVPLTGLDPATTYHYRFVAQSGGGGPVFGADHTFTTFPEPSGAAPCPNDVFRGGASAGLPNCRAYEMVSPLDKGNGDVLALPTTLKWSTALNQSSGDGEKLTYTSFRSFADPQGAPYAAQYIASRDPGAGWLTRAISPTRGGPSFFEGGEALKREFKAFSSDLCQAWLLHDTDPPLAAGAPAGYPDLYRSDECDGGGYEALNRTEPQNVLTENFKPELQGVSEDGSRAVFRINEKLAVTSGPEASGSGNFQLYEAFGEGKLRLVSVLPNGQASEGNSSAGTANGAPADGVQSVMNAVSDDGLRVFWTTGAVGIGSEDVGGVGPGKIFLRANGKNPTIKVSESVTTEPAYFQGASVDGAKAFFRIEGGAAKGDLYEFVVAENAAHLIAHRMLGDLVGASEDASRIYFVSEDVLGAGATAGKPNLYRFENSGSAPGSYRFIGTLPNASEGAASPFGKGAVRRSAVVSDDGEQVVFTSTASLTGYDNRDLNSGEPDVEVYFYDATGNSGAGKLRCLSCNPSGARPVGRKLRLNPWEGLWVAARITPPTSQLYTPQVLSKGGHRVFFDSFDRLVLGDTNGVADVYEWEAPGTGGCDGDSPSFSGPSEGCLSLISSGKSATDSTFLDASPSGSDAFFATAASLLPQDYGLVDVYDAREGGGFKTPDPPRLPCEGEACQHPGLAPSDPTPASSAFSGPGNQSAAARKPCAKGKVRRKGRCVVKKQRRHHKRPQHGRRAAR